MDQNLRYQQNLAAAGVAIVVLIVKSNHLDQLVPLVPSAMIALVGIQPGDVVEIVA